MQAFRRWGHGNPLHLPAFVDAVPHGEREGAGGADPGPKTVRIDARGAELVAAAHVELAHHGAVSADEDRGSRIGVGSRRRNRDAVARDGTLMPTL